MEILRKVEFLEGYLAELQGIELLDYHNKNHLAYDNKRCSEEKQRLITDAQQTLKGIKEIVKKL